ncbi:hypothetical protein [Streptomyces sp. MK5]|uniref:hypothetical protein n=1 Tax=Streptomyces sp. MK5 TaxID=3064253 RepID=UPI002740B759|nr:hypothetical protein [Streptomyces sp. MK5]
MDHRGQLPGPLREFTTYLDGLLARLDPAGGWCGIFWQRDPEGMRACVEGREVPPWDVMEALLHDLTADHRPAALALERDRARALYAAAVTAYDTRPGGREALGDRLDVMLREQRYAAERQAELSRDLATATTPDRADALRADLAWAHDDFERATARCAEIRSRLADLDRATTPVGRRPGAPSAMGVPGGEAGPALAPGTDGYGAAGTVLGSQDGHGPQAGARPGREGTPAGPELGQGRLAEAPAPAPPVAPAPAPPVAEPPRKRRRGSARFAGMTEAEDAAPEVVPLLPPQTAAHRPTPRGARFAGAAAGAVPERTATSGTPVDDTARQLIARTVRTLLRLRGEGRGGEAHALLIEAVHWPAPHLPPLAAELERAGLGADWTTLLWEAASLPAERLVEAADALLAAGRGADSEQIVRQGVARPAPEIGEAVLGLAARGRDREVRVLLDAYVRVRTPEQAARSAEADPWRLVPLLLDAARSVSDERHWDLLHALRVAGLAT